MKKSVCIIIMSVLTAVLGLILIGIDIVFLEFGIGKFIFETFALRFHCIIRSKQ